MACAAVHVQESNGQSESQVGGTCSENFSANVGVHQISVLSLLFILVLEALSREFITRYPWELHYADDLVTSSSMLEEITKE